MSFNKIKNKKRGVLGTQQQLQIQFNTGSKCMHTSGHTQRADWCDPARILGTDCYHICGLQTGSSVVKSTWKYLATLENSLFSLYFLKSLVLKEHKSIISFANAMI